MFVAGFVQGGMMYQPAPEPTGRNFSVETAGGLSREHISALLNGDLAALRIPGMLTSDECRGVVDTVSRLGLSAYDTERVNPPILRLGPSLNDYRHAGRVRPEYWAAVEAAGHQWKSARFDPDPLDVCRNHLAKNLPRSLEAATSLDGRQLHSGVIREIDFGALVHYDNIVREFPDGFLGCQLRGQLAFNVYMALPDNGGETVIWRRSWRAEDESARVGYGYDEKVTEGCPQQAVRSAVGDGLLFNCHQYHAVRPGDGSRRIALGFFIGVTVDNDLAIWS